MKSSFWKNTLRISAFLALAGVVALGGLTGMVEKAEAEATYTTHYIATTGDDTSGDGSEGNPWATINHAISRAENGDTIVLSPGNYSITEMGGEQWEPVCITKSLTLQGAGSQNTILDPGFPAGVHCDVIAVRSSNVNISGLSITGGTFGVRVPGFGYGTTISDITLTDVIVDNCTGSGFVFDGTEIKNIVFNNCRFVNNGNRGMYFAWGKKADNVRLFDTSCDGNQIMGFNTQSTTTGLTITGGTFNNNLGGSPRGTSEGPYYGFGISLEFCTDAHLTGITVQTNGMAEPYYGAGINVKNSSATMTDADIRNNKNGIWCSETHDTTIENSIIADNEFQNIGNSATVPAVKAVRNWWNTADGEAITNTLNGNVLYDPFYNNDTMTDLVHSKNIYNTTQDIGYDKIQAAINDADEGDVINIASGTFNEAIDINKRITLQGTGNDKTTGTILKNATVSTLIGGYRPVIVVSASGTPDNPVLIKDLLVTPNTGSAGASQPGIFLRPGYSISNINVDNAVITGSSPSGTGETGLLVENDTTLEHLVITGCEFNDMSYGINFEKTKAIYSADSVRYVTINDTIFNNNSIKGLYAEKLSDATFTDVIVTNNSNVTLAPDWSAPWNSGIDINLKYGNYQNLVFNNLTVNGNGIGHIYGTGLVIKARGTGTDSYNEPWELDGSTYTGATLDGVEITGGTFSENIIAIRFGDEGKNNTTPTNVNISNVNISKTNKSGLVNLLATGVKICAENNYWDSPDGPEHTENTYNVGNHGATAVGNINFVPWLDTMNGNEVTPIVNGLNNFASLQSAIDGASPGDTINVISGTYTENTIINKSITLLGPNANVNPNKGTRKPEAVLQSANAGARPLRIISISEDGKPAVSDITIKGFKFVGRDDIAGTAGIVNYNQKVTTDDVIIENNVFTDFSNTAKAIAIYKSNGPELPRSSGWIIRNNRFVNFTDGPSAMQVGSLTGSSITGNVIENSYGGIDLDRVDHFVCSNNELNNIAKQGINLANPCWDVTISNNTIIQANTLNDNKGGIYLWANDFTGHVIVTGNTISNSSNGVAIKDSPDITDKDIHINYNSFIDNANKGIYFTGTGSLDAKYNWWGTSIEAAIKTKVSDTVDYNPWHLKLLTVPAVLAADRITTTSVILNWTAEGTWEDDYLDFRYSTAPITTEAEWNKAKRITGEPVPAEGTEQQMIIRGLKENTKYYFAMAIGYQNVNSAFCTVDGTTKTEKQDDTTTPGAVTGLSAAAGTPATTKVTLSWTTTGDDGTTGFAQKYVIKRSTSEITNDNFDSTATIYNNMNPKASGNNETFTVNNLAPGTQYWFAVQTLDEAGNKSEIAVTDPITTAGEIPSVTGITPPAETHNGEPRQLTVTGSNLNAGTPTVRLVKGSEVITLTGVTDVTTNELKATVPAGVPAGTYKARVINNNGTSKLSGVTYTVMEAPAPLPAVTNVVPNMAISNTEKPGVKLIGKNFTGAISVKINGTNAVTFTVNNDTQITLTAPALPAGEYDIQVTTSGTNSVSTVKYIVTDPVTINENTTEDTTTSTTIETTGTIPVQVTLTTDNGETATKNTDNNAEISVVISPATTVTSNGAAYTGTINPPRVVKPDATVHSDLPETAIVIEMGNPDQTINFNQDFVTTVRVEAETEPDIYYFNKTTKKYELAGKNGEKDGIVYTKGGTVLGVEKLNGTSLYTIGLLMDHMSTYVASTENLLPIEPTPPVYVPPVTEPETPKGTTDVRGFVSSEGRFTSPVIVISEDESIVLSIHAGTVGLTSDLEPLDTISLTAIINAPEPPQGKHIIGTTWNLGPDGAIFEPAVNLTMPYDPADLPEGITGDDLVLAWYDEANSEWVLLETTVDTVNRTVTAQVSHFTTFGLISSEPGETIEIPTEPEEKPVEQGETPEETEITPAETVEIPTEPDTTIESEDVSEASVNDTVKTGFTWYWWLLISAGAAVLITLGFILWRKRRYWITG